MSETKTSSFEQARIDLEKKIYNDTMDAAEGDVSFQLWICPICCDDHRPPVSDEVLCKPADLLVMRKEIKALEDIARTQADGHKAVYLSYEALKRDRAALQADFDNLVIQHRAQKGSALSNLLSTHARLENKIADAIGKHTAEAFIRLINSMDEKAKK